MSENSLRAGVLPCRPGVTELTGGRAHQPKGHSTYKQNGNEKRAEIALAPVRAAVIIVEKSALLRLGIEASMARSRFSVIASVSGLAEIPEGTCEEREAVVLIGVDDNRPDSKAQIAQLRERNPKVRIVFLADVCNQEQLVQAAEAGGSGYLLKGEITPARLCKSLDLVLAGGAVVPHSFAQLFGNCTGSKLDASGLRSGSATMLESPAPGQQRPANMADVTVPLSQQEQMVLRQLTRGASNKHIARELGIAEATVKVHVKSLLRKIRVSNRTQAALWAMRHL